MTGTPPTGLAAERGARTVTGMTLLGVFPCLRIFSRATIGWNVDALGF